MSKQKVPCDGHKITVLGSGHGRENSTLFYEVDLGGKYFRVFHDFSVVSKYTSGYVPQKEVFYIAVSHLHPDHINWGSLFLSVLGKEIYSPVIIAPKGTHKFFERALASYPHTGMYHANFEIWEVSSSLDPYKYKQEESTEPTDILVKYKYKQGKDFEFKVANKDTVPLGYISNELFSPLRFFSRNERNGVELQQTFGNHSLPVLESAVVNAYVDLEGLSTYLVKKHLDQGNFSSLFSYIKKTFKDNFPHSKSKAVDLENKLNDYVRTDLNLHKNKALINVHFSKMSYLTDTLVNDTLLSRFGSLVGDSNVIFAGANKLVPEYQKKAEHFSLDDLVSIVNLSFADNKLPVIELMHSPSLLGTKGLLNLPLLSLGGDYFNNEYLKQVVKKINSLREMGYRLNIAFPGLQVRILMDKRGKVVFVNKKGALFELP